MSMTSIKPNCKMSAFCIWSWTPTGKSGYLASGRDKKDKRLSPKNRLWCRMRLWDSEWPRNWGLDWEGEGWWLCLMLADLFLTENYNLFQLSAASPSGKDLSSSAKCIAISHWSSMQYISKSMIQTKWFFILSGHKMVVMVCCEKCQNCWQVPQNCSSCWKSENAVLSGKGMCQTSFYVGRDTIWPIRHFGLIW